MSKNDDAADWMSMYQDDGPVKTTSNDSLPSELEDKTTAELPKRSSKFNADLAYEGDSFTTSGKLFFGVFLSAGDVFFIRQHDIRLIVNCGYELINCFPCTVAYKKIPLDDVCDAPLREYL